VIIISAMSSDRVIGSGNGMPWNVPEEYEQFLRYVDGQAVIMGRRSFEIFGPDLRHTANIVVSRSAVRIEGARVCSTIQEAIASARAPIMVTPQRFKTPWFSRSRLRFRAVWPPMVGRRRSGRSSLMISLRYSTVSGSM